MDQKYIRGTNHSILRRHETLGTVYDFAMAISNICQAFHTLIPATSNYSKILIDSSIA